MCVGGADLIDGGKNSVKRQGKEKYLSLATGGNVCLTEHLNWRLLSSMSNINLINLSLLSLLYNCVSRVDSNVCSSTEDKPTTVTIFYLTDTLHSSCIADSQSPHAGRLLQVRM